MTTPSPHEWGHAYTESTSGLIYQWQAGAMNEAYSDIWGETVDMLNDRENEVGEPDGTRPRTEGDCSQYTPRRRSTIDDHRSGRRSPVRASAVPAVRSARSSPSRRVDGDRRWSALDADEPDGGPTHRPTAARRSPTPGEIAGNWVYVDRGTCPASPTQGRSNAEHAGAIGIVVGDNVDRSSRWDHRRATPTIYGVHGRRDADGTKFKSAEWPGRRSAIERSSRAPTTTRPHRWLSGEDDPAFGGAIRDMWNPTCYGDPGKVSDAEYHCDTDDSGGVHTNSGVVNHTFAILVDGSTYNGVTVPAIGLDKAAWLFWHTQTNYLTPIVGLPRPGRRARGLLRGPARRSRLQRGHPRQQPRPADGSDGDAGDPELVGGTTAADCAAVDAAIAATELRREPGRSATSAAAARARTPRRSAVAPAPPRKATYTEDFEDGLAGWTQDEELGFAGASGIPWEAIDDRARAVTPVAWPSAPTRVDGQLCADARRPHQPQRPDQPGHHRARPATTPRLSFDHYVATEVEWDGGNVKVSVNGGAFALVPADAYLFNAPGADAATAAAGNTNPMAGEPAWTGTDGGQLSGSWGTSIVDLSAIAAATPVTRVKFRFDMGRDGCNGVDGWYVDNVKVQVCEQRHDDADPDPRPPRRRTPRTRTRTKVKLKPAKVERNEAFKVIVTVKSDAGDLTGQGEGHARRQEARHRQAEGRPCRAEGRGDASSWASTRSSPSTSAPATSCAARTTPGCA